MRATRPPWPSTASSRSISWSSTSTRSGTWRARRESSEADVVESIDIGGPAMVRAAAKNFAAVAVLVDPERYGFVLDELRESAGDLSLDTRRELAAEAFAHTAGYDIAIANWFSDTESFPERQLRRARQGDRSRLRREPAPARGVLHGGRCASPPALDGDPARRQAALVQQPARSRRRHPARAGIHSAGLRDRQARQPLRLRAGCDARRGLSRGAGGDPASAFGGVVAVNRPLSRELAALVAEQFVEVLHAPGYGEGAIDLLR